MHIVFVLSPFGGPEAYVKTLLPWLERLGHRVSIIYIKRSAEKHNAFPSHVQVELVSSTPVHYYLAKVIGNWRAWPRRLRSWEYALAVRDAVSHIDRIHPVDVIEGTEGHIVTLLKSRWKTILRAHGSDWSFRHFCQDGDTTYDDFVIHQQAKQMKSADAVVAISNHLADHLSDFCKFPRESIHVIPYGIDTAVFSPEGPMIQMEGNPVLLSIGRLEHRKGTDVLIRAMPLIWEHFPQTTLYLLGNESQYKRNQLLEWIPLEKRHQIIFPGFVPHEQLPLYYRSATIYIAPTQYETFGYTILEAMACGKPVVSTNVGAVPELLQHGKNGFLIPFGDPFALAMKIIEALSQPNLLHEMSTAARKKALKYDIKHNAMQNEQMYHQVRFDTL